MFIKKNQQQIHGVTNVWADDGDFSAGFLKFTSAVDSSARYKNINPSYVDNEVLN